MLGIIHSFQFWKRKKFKMIAKCLVVLAVVAQISAFKCNQECIGYMKPQQSMTNGNCKYSYQPTQSTEKYQRIFTTPGSKSSSTQSYNGQGYSKTGVNSAPITRNLVARGKYPITLQNCGPAPEKKIPVVTSHVRVPVQEKPTVRLQTKIPAPKTISHTCTCFKTIVKPRVQQHLITVPSIQRYIETMHRPVIENIHYEAYPIKCTETTNEEAPEQKNKNEAYQVQPVEVSCIPEVQMQMQNEKSLGMKAFEFPTVQEFQLPKMETEKPQLIEIPQIRFTEDGKSQSIEIPRVQFVQNQQAQEIKIPRVQFIQNKEPQTVEIHQGIELPRVQFIESQKSEAFEIPRTQFLEEKKPQIMEIPNTHVGNNKAETIELARLEFLQAQKPQTVEIPRIQMEESPKVQTVEFPHQSGTIRVGCATPFTYQF